MTLAMARGGCCFLSVFPFCFSSLAGTKHLWEGRLQGAACMAMWRGAFIACRTGKGRQKGSNINIVVYE
jgi:hypothetical protein